MGPVQDKGGQVYNVKAYGAKGDGVTNDTAAIRAAIAAALLTGGTVYLPPGNYVYPRPPLSLHDRSVSPG